MTERERLIELLTTEIECDIDGHGDCSMCKYKYSDKDCERHICNKLADHLLSNGVIVPPCQIGDMLYYPFVALDVEGKEYGEMASGEAVSFSKDNRQRWVYSRYGNGLTMWHTFDDFGKTVFLAKEKAEKALKERGEGK